MRRQMQLSMCVIVPSSVSLTSASTTHGLGGQGGQLCGALLTTSAKLSSGGGG
jgi:hypothetical protein